MTRAYAIYRGSRFERYIRAESFDNAQGFAESEYGRLAEVCTNGPAFAPGAGVDCFGFYPFNAPSTTAPHMGRQS